MKKKRFTSARLLKEVMSAFSQHSDGKIWFMFTDETSLTDVVGEEVSGRLEKYLLKEDRR